MLDVSPFTKELLLESGVIQRKLIQRRNIIIDIEKKESEDNNNFCHKLHAEINCLNQIKHLDINFSKVKLYIYRIRKDQPYGMARPCPSCMAAIKDLGIKNIYYTTNDGYSYERLENNIVGGVA